MAEIELTKKEKKNEYLRAKALFKVFRSSPFMKGSKARYAVSHVLYWYKELHNIKSPAINRCSVKEINKITAKIKYLVISCTPIK